jgi:hypothetical protein
LNWLSLAVVNANSQKTSAVVNLFMIDTYRSSSGIELLRNTIT